MPDDMDFIPVPAELDHRIDNALHQLKREKHSHFLRKTSIAFASAAAAAAAFFTVCAANPAWAATLPVIGSLFRSTQTEVSYKGDYAKNAYAAGNPDVSAGTSAQMSSDAAGETLTVTSSAEVEVVSDKENDASAKALPDDEITMEIPEVTCTSKALYLAVTLTSRNGFPEGFRQTENEPAYSLGYDCLSLLSEGEISGGNTSTVTLHTDQLQGHYADASHFKGIIRCDLSTMTVPADSFTAKLKITKLYGDLPDEMAYQNYTGTWDFTIPVRVDPSREQTVAVNDKNADGYGIAAVTETPYEVTADMMLPDAKQKTDVFLAICDASGDLLEYQGENTDTYSTYGRDTSRVFIFICDADDYLNNLKGYYYSEEYAQKKATMNFAQYLKQHSLYSTEVSFD